MSVERHICVDLETFGVSARAVIIEVGAVEFDLRRGRLGREFGRAVEWHQAGRTVDASTMAWWFQRRERGHEVPQGIEPLVEVLAALALWMAEGGELEQIRLWSKGPSFDAAILADAFRQEGLRKPWHHWLERDVRTVMEQARELGWQRQSQPSVAHRALDDARAEALAVCEASAFLAGWSQSLKEPQVDLRRGWEVYADRLGLAEWFRVTETVRLAFEDAVAAALEGGAR